MITKYEYQIKMNQILKEKIEEKKVIKKPNKNLISIIKLKI
jgi:hypothetical protein